MAKLTVGQATAVRDVIRYLESLAAEKPSDLYTAELAATSLAGLAADGYARMMAGPGQNDAHVAIAVVEQLRDQLRAAHDRADLLHEALADAARNIPGVTDALNRANAVLRADADGQLSPRHTDAMGRPQFCDAAEAEVVRLRALIGRTQ